MAEVLKIGPILSKGEENNGENVGGDKGYGTIPAGESSAPVQRKCFEDVYAAMGPPGRYQLIQSFLIIISQIPMVFLNIKYVFISLEPDFRCTAVNETILLEDYPMVIRNRSSYHVSYNDSCHIGISKNVSGELKPYKDIGCINGYNYTGGHDVSFITEWDLVCDKHGIPELAQTVIAVGAFLGSFIVNILADKYGRWTMLVFAIVLTCSSEIATAYAPNIYALIALRFFSGVVSAGIQTCCYVLGMEMIGNVENYRIVYGMANATVFPIFIGLLSGIAYAYRESSWRKFQLHTAIVSLFPLLYIYFIKESAYWLYSIGKKSRSEKILQSTCKTNGVSFNKIKELFENCSPANQINDSVTKKDETIDNDKMTIYKSKKFIVSVAIAWFAFFTMEMTYAGFYLTASTLVGNFYLNIALIGLIGIPGAVVNWILLKYCNRRRVIMSLLVMTIICLLISTFILDADINEDVAGKISLTFFLLGKFAISCCYDTFLLCIPELFQTNVRASGMGISSSGSTFGAGLAPYLLPFKTKIVSWGPGVLTSACCFITLLLLFKLPKTKAKQSVAPLDLDDAIKDEKNDKVKKY